MPQWIGYRELRPQAGDCLDGPLGVEMPRPDLRAPAGYGHERDVEGAELGHALEQVRVAGEVHPARSCDRVAERRRLDAERPAGAVVLGERCRDAQAADRDGSRPPRPRPRAGSAAGARGRRSRAGKSTGSSRPRRSSDGRSRWSQWPCEMSAASRPRSADAAGAPRPAQVEHAAAEHGIGEEANAVHVHEHGRVPDVRDAEGHG